MSRNSFEQDRRMWTPIGNRKVKVVLWGIVHNHARGKFDALMKLTDDFEVVGWVDDTASTAMRMQEPVSDYYEKERGIPRVDGEKVLSHEIPCDLVVIEVSNAELVGVATKLAAAGYPMHMDKPLGADLEGFRRMSGVCEACGIPLQIGYMFRSNEAINKMVELARNGILGEIYSIDADLDHNYGYPKYPEYASSYPGGTAYLLACHVIEWALPIFNDELPLRVHSVVKPAPGDPEWAMTHTLTILEWPRANATIRVCSRGTQPCRHIRIDGTSGSMELEPIEDFRTVKHTTGLNEGLAKVDTLEIKLFLRTANDRAKAEGFHDGINRIVFKAPEDRYAGQLRELARIVRGEIPNPPGLYLHDLKVHKVSLQACNIDVSPRNAAVARPAPAIDGPFPLLCTPYAGDGSLDCAVLAREAKFVADCGANGVIWPPADEAMKLLTADEERRGLEAMADALDGTGVCFCPCCPGKDTADTLRRVAVAEEIAARHPSLKMAMLARLADDAKDDADHERHYEAVAAAVGHPVIIQTYNGISPLPKMALMVELAKRHPEIYGWYKVEGSDRGISDLMAELVAAKPAVKTVFTGWGGRDWLYQYRRIGTRGVITQRPMYADLISAIWRALESGSAAADDLFAKFIYLRNLDDVLPSGNMRGWNLYVLRRRGVFTNMLSRVARDDGSWELENVSLGEGQIAEIDARLRLAGLISSCPVGACID